MHWFLTVYIRCTSCNILWCQICRNMFPYDIWIAIIVAAVNRVLLFTVCCCSCRRVLALHCHVSHVLFSFYTSCVVSAFHVMCCVMFDIRDQVSLLQSCAGVATAIVCRCRYCNRVQVSLQQCAGVATAVVCSCRYCNRMQALLVQSYAGVATAIA